MANPFDVDLNLHRKILEQWAITPDLFEEQEPRELTFPTDWVLNPDSQLRTVRTNSYIDILIKYAVSTGQEAVFHS